MTRYGLAYRVPPFIRFAVVADSDGEVTGVWGLDGAGHLWACMFDGNEWSSWKRLSTPVHHEHTDEAVAYTVDLDETEGDRK